ncbi:pilus assembly protein TadG-related protein [Granulicella paludicola]|uniref:pilus assembly protein TadG-related protein n=1 Tax=Granulicella paludicola TaxID=474951 RepID=UPI0021DFF6B8|nr:pilus assembly protein TadG-related protein [Granulicella paludicola]
MDQRRSLQNIGISFFRDESGQTAIIAAVCLVMLVSFIGLAIDVGNLRYQQRKLQAAADAAALAAALELQSCGTSHNCSAMQTAASKSVTENAYTGAALVLNCGATASSGLTLMLNNPVCANGSSDPNASNTNYVEVVMKQYKSTYFASLLGFTSVPVVARAEATRAPAPCIYALDKTSTNAISVDALAALQAQCPIVDESSSPSAFGCNVLAAVSATLIRVTGGTEGLLCAGVNPPPEVHAPIPTPADPLAYLPKPAVPSTCTGSPTLGLTSLQILGTATLSPGRYCGGIIIGPAANVTFLPGTYVLTNTGLLGIPLLGGLTVTAGATVQGNGVTFYNDGPSNGLTGGITFAGTLPLISNINLVAPTTGTYAGILFFQDPNDTAPAILAASIGGGTKLEGAFYFPSASVSYAVSGSAKFNILVAKDIDFTVLTIGGTAYEQSVFGNNYSTLPGGSPIPATGAVLIQ